MCCVQFNQCVAQTNNGKVYLSECKTAFKIVYNNIIILHEVDIFAEFLSNVSHCCEHHKDYLDSEKREIVFSTVVRNMLLKFSLDEIRELNYLLNTAFLEADIRCERYWS